MKKPLLWIVLSATLLASGINQAKAAKLSQKGEKIVQTFCEANKLPKAEETIEQLMEQIKASQACSALSQDKLEAVAYYIVRSPIQEPKNQHIHVPYKANCPVCGMFVAKYPKWAATMTIGDTTYYFDGVKDMMKYYIFEKNFVYDRSKISQIHVGDYYTLDAIDAKEAFYVVDPNVYGPMGRELVPFKSLEKAKSFLQEHKGKKIVRFNEITAKMVMALDGVE